MKAKITVSWEYELKPGLYPDNATPDEMLGIDIDAYMNNPDTIMSEVSNGAYTVHGELVESEI